MICPRCGTVNADDAERCSRCQGSLAPRPERSAVLPVSDPAAAPAPTAESTGDADMAGAAPSAPGPPEDQPPGWAPPPGTPGGGPQPPGWPPPPGGSGSPPPPGWGPPQAWGPPPAPPGGPSQGSGPSPGWGSPGPPAGWPPPGAAPQPWARGSGWGAPAGPPVKDSRRSDRSGSGWGGQGQLPNYLPQAIICAVVFNLVAGIVAIVYAVQVNKKSAAGDWDGAVRASRLARTWCWISVVIGVVFLVLLLSGAIHNPY